MTKWSAWWSELRESRFRLVPASRVGKMSFAIQGTLLSARRATDRTIRMGRVLEHCAVYLKNHPGNGERRLRQTNLLRDEIRKVLER